MSNVLPPTKFTGHPYTERLATGTLLYRCHQARLPAAAFNPIPSHQYYGGGRFDGTRDDPYPFMYVGLSADCAIAETLLRDLPNDASGVAQLPRAKVSGRRLSVLVTTTDLELVDLRGLLGQRAVAQDSWLVSAEPREYAQTRHWGHWIRSHAPAFPGFLWRSRRDQDLQALVLFGDRIPPDAVTAAPSGTYDPNDSIDFDTDTGRGQLRARLAKYRVELTRHL